MKARVNVSLKPSVHDPQGQAIERALKSLGFEGVDGVRQGKIIELELATDDAETALAQVEDMCAQLLANPVIETYSVDIVG